MLYLRKSILTLGVVAVAAAGVLGQTAGQASTDVDTVVGNAAARTQAYTETFKDLLSEERKTFEIYDKNGKVKKRRTVDSTFLVYQLSRGGNLVSEFRNVTAVDGKPLGDTDNRARNFFEKVAAAQDVQTEIDRIREESTRYDEDFAVSGLTLFPAIALSDELRNSFAFTSAGTEEISGKRVHVIAFEQSRPHPSITVNARKLPESGVSHNYDVEIDGGDTELNPRIRGRMWIDADTFNLRREIRERTIQPDGYEQPLVVATDEFDFSDSDFGILTPTRITHIQYRVKLKDRRALKDTRIEFVYTKFTRPDVEVKDSRIAP